jgi:hypothetical protein
MMQLHPKPQTPEARWLIINGLSLYMVLSWLQTRFIPVENIMKADNSNSLDSQIQRNGISYEPNSYDRPRKSLASSMYSTMA